MGNPKQKWTAEEEEALRAGVAKHGAGKWKNIQKDPEFNPFLYSRSNIDLKDKWRNMSVANGTGPREKSRIIKPKANPEAPSTPLAIPQVSASTTPVANDAPTDAVMEESKCVSDGKTVSKSSIVNSMLDMIAVQTTDLSSAPKRNEYSSMIYEALSTMNDPRGSDTSSIVSFIEQKHEVPLPPTSRKALTGRLRRLVGQGKLEKVQNCYRFKRETLPEAKVPAPNQKCIQPRLLQNNDYIETPERVSVEAAYRVAEAENKSHVAAEAVKEAERVTEMAEEADSLLQLANEIFERCSRGEIVMMA